VAFSESVPAAGERNCLFVVHRHACEGLAHQTAGFERIGLAARAFRIHINQPHLHSGERVFEVASAGKAGLVVEPFLLVSPVDVNLRRPDVLAPASETEGLETHRFQRDVARKDDEVGPGDFFAVLLFDRPQQPARLVKVDVVGPAIERGKTLVAVSRAGHGRRRCGKCQRCAMPCG